MCPVLAGRLASSDITTMFRGKEVRFCCNECKQEFIDNPEIYLSELPQFRDISWSENLTAMLDTQARTIACAGLISLLVGLRLLRWWRPVPASSSPSFLGRFTSRKISPAIPLAILCGLLGFQVYSLQAKTHDHWMEDHMHFATFYDYGFPPVPPRPKIEPKMVSTYYRGNDERSPRLFNNGNYRTSTFHLSVVDAEGQPVKHGEEVLGRELFVRFEIDRPPFTPDFLYDEDLMNTMFLTKKCEKFLGRDSDPADRVGLTSLEHMQRWEALYPLGKLCRNCEEGKRGIIYLCEEYYHESYWWTKEKVRGGSRYHYALSYQLSVQNGKLAATSELWMGSLYRTRKFPKWKVSMDEWFSHQPIPVLPSENIEDPELLGLDEHLGKLGK